MIKLKDLLIERGTIDVLFHATSAHPLLSILKEDKLRFTPVVGTRADFEMNRGKFYFLSTSRVKYGGYSRSLSPSGYVNMVLDGRELGSQARGVSVDYWGKDFKDAAKAAKNRDQMMRYDENEERLITDKPFVSPLRKYVHEIHVCVPEKWYMESGSRGGSHIVAEIEKLAKQRKVPLFLYRDFNDIKFLNKRKAVQSVAELGYGTAPEPEEPYDSNYRDSYLDGVVELLNANSRKDLRKDGEFVYKEISRGRSPDAFSTQLSNAIHNNKSRPQMADTIYQITRAMRKMRVNNVTDFVDKLKMGKVDMWKMEDEAGLHDEVTWSYIKGTVDILDGKLRTKDAQNLTRLLKQKGNRLDYKDVSKIYDYAYWIKPFKDIAPPDKMADAERLMDKFFDVNARNMHEFMIDHILPLIK